MNPLVALELITIGWFIIIVGLLVWVIKSSAE